LDKLAAVLISADSVRDGLEDKIIQDLIDLDLRLVFSKYCRLTVESVKLIYPRLINKPFFPALTHNFIFGSVRLDLLAGSRIYEKIGQAKGIFQIKNGNVLRTGLRLKYAGPAIPKLFQLGYRGKQLFYRALEFRFHAADNLDETIKLCRLLLQDNELNSLALRYPLFGRQLTDKLA